LEFTRQPSNQVNAPTGVTIQEAPVAGLGEGLTVPPISANVYKFSVAEAASGKRN
jgi:hypothetical protein